MGKKSTKESIAEAALDLFSTQGFEATSVSQIAEAVGIRKASLYSHFNSKQEILDFLVQTAFVEYEKHSVFANADWDDPEFTKDKENFSVDLAVLTVMRQIRYIMHDPLIYKSRKMLTIEQFQNEKLKKLQTKQNYTDVMRYFTGLIKFLIRREEITETDTEIAAAQLCLPISVWLNLCDREPERENEIMDLIKRHIRQFFKIYGLKGRE